MGLNRLKIDERGSLFLNGYSLSATVNKVTVDDAVVWEKKTLLLESGNEKIFNGYEDSSITIDFTIYEALEGGETRYKHLNTAMAAFKKVEEKTAALYLLEGPLFKAMNLKEAYFDTINVTTVYDSFRVKVVLTENNPQVSKVQEQQQSASAAPKAEASFTGMSEAEKAKLERIEGVYN